MSPRVRTDESGPDRAKRHQATQNAIRTKAASAVRIVFGSVAAVLALGALLVVLRANVNEDNVIVMFVTDVADAISGPFSRDNGVFDFQGKNADSKNALVNWGIAAIAYLAIDRLIASAIGPRSGR